MTDTYPPPASGGQPADDGPWESGIPPRAEAADPLARSQAHAAAALSGCARAEAGLGTLLRSVQHLAAAVSSAREAKSDVVQELATLRGLLGEAEEQQLTLKHRAALLEHALERLAREAAREKAFLVEEQDVFIAGLWDDHQQELSDLRRRLALAEQTQQQSQEEIRALSTNGENAHREIEEQTRRLRKAEAEVARLLGGGREERDRLHRAQLEREEAQLAAAQALRERDQLRAELGRLKATLASNAKSSTSSAQPSPTVPIPLVVRSEVGRMSTESARMTAARMDKDLEAPRSPSQMSISSRHPSVPPEELRAALPALELEPSSRAAPSSVSRSPIKQKPDPSTRPLIGYSLSGDLPEERIESARPSSRPPR